MMEYYIKEKQSHMGQLSNENKSGTDWLLNKKNKVMNIKSRKQSHKQIKSRKWSHKIDSYAKCQRKIYLNVKKINTTSIKLPLI